jgi:excisionase family DNA binding protein
MMEKVTYSVKEAAAVLGISPTKMYELVRSDSVPNIKFGKRFVIPKARFHDWVNDVVQGGEKHARHCR